MNRKKDIIVRPKFIRQIKARSPEDAQTKRAISSKNTGTFYAHLFTTIGGGTVHHSSRDEIEEVFSGDRRNFLPDVVHNRKTGKGYTEIKAVSTRTSQPQCYFGQLENYCLQLLKRIDEGDELPWVDYAFFRYGDRNLCGQSSFTNQELMRKLAQNTRDLLILPLNLVFLVLMNSPSEVRDHSSNSQTRANCSYWKVRSSMLNLFHMNSEKAVERVLEDDRYIGNLERDDLFIDELYSMKLESPRIHTPKPNIIKPFEITKFRLPYLVYKEWLYHFKNNHQRILGELGIRDLYAESSDGNYVPERIEREKIPEKPKDDVPF